MDNRYSSFKEIDDKLRLLQLKREIDRESLKLHFNQTKAALNPLQLVGGFRGKLQTLLLTFAIKKLKNIFQRNANWE